MHLMSPNYWQITIMCDAQSLVPCSVHVHVQHSVPNQGNTLDVLVATQFPQNHRVAFATITENKCNINIQEFILCLLFNTLLVLY